MPLSVPAGQIRLSALVIAGAILGCASPTMAVTPGGEPVPAVWPVEPHVVMRAYDPPGCIWCDGHRGVDLASMPAAPVRTAIGGEVTYAGRLAGRGVVVVDDGARRTTYEPVAATVQRGQHVNAGDVIGRMELVQSHCFPDACLHLGLIRDADHAYLDPMDLFGARSRAVRLLPLWEGATPVPEQVLAAVTTAMRFFPAAVFRLAGAPAGRPPSAAPN